MPEGIVKRKGEQYYRERTEAMSPEKRLIVNKMYRARVQDLDITTDEKISRIGQQYVNKMIKSAFTTIHKKADLESDIFDEFAPNVNDEELLNDE